MDELSATHAPATLYCFNTVCVQMGDRTRILDQYHLSVRSKSVTPIPEEFASSLLDYDNDRFELCYGVVEGVPGGSSVNIAKGGNIPKDVVEVLLKFGVKPSPHDENDEAGDHHDRILAMHEQSITKLLALPSNSEKKINKTELQHDGKSIMEAGILVWLPVSNVKLSKNASKVFAGMKVQSAKEASERSTASHAAKEARKKAAKEMLGKAKRKADGGDEAAKKKRKKGKAAVTEEAEQAEQAGEAGEVVEDMELEASGDGGDGDENGDGPSDGNGEDETSDEDAQDEEGAQAGKDSGDDE
ncbi:hypothetical protein CYMTET_37842 [Cymbomonas tetramitiformis]|uniref:Uncharacterized protein n=1 Tax=Cymbomonas tetramitiformis TaxID=36881 RepID=A0AAE0CD93_9CHLO|nr:hypothetical protein CYMTET_37842 [Cymbomonas tetramitiformis]